jgi:hypothetical protein
VRERADRETEGEGERGVKPFSCRGEGSDEARGVAEVNIFIDASVNEEKLAGQVGDMVHHIAGGVAVRIVDGAAHVSFCVVTVIAICVCGGGRGN